MRKRKRRGLFGGPLKEPQELGFCFPFSFKPLSEAYFLPNAHQALLVLLFPDSGSSVFLPPFLPQRPRFNLFSDCLACPPYSAPPKTPDALVSISFFEPFVVLSSAALNLP